MHICETTQTVWAVVTIRQLKNIAAYPAIMSSTKDCDSGSGNAARYGLAITASVFSSAGTAGGMVMQKWAHNEQQALPDDGKWGEHEGIIFSPMWMMGVIVLMVIPVSRYSPTALPATDLAIRMP